MIYRHCKCRTGDLATRSPVAFSTRQVIGLPLNIIVLVLNFFFFFGKQAKHTEIPFASTRSNVWASAKRLLCLTVIKYTGNRYRRYDISLRVRGNSHELRLVRRFSASVAFVRKFICLFWLISTEHVIWRFTWTTVIYSYNTRCELFRTFAATDRLRN